VKSSSFPAKLASHRQPRSLDDLLSVVRRSLIEPASSSERGSEHAELLGAPPQLPRGVGFADSSLSLPGHWRIEYQSTSRFPTASVCLIVPCYNEEQRLDRERFLAFARNPKVDLLLVDDGSKDATKQVLEELEARSEGGIRTFSLPKNAGKGEAVRQGLLRAIHDGAEIVGFADADLSTSPEQLLMLLGQVEAPGVQAAIGARVMLVGRHIERKPTRHYLGRIYATLAGAILRIPFYDTQCGAKFFRVTPLLTKTLSTPFLSRWAFDLELLGRLLVGVDGERGLRPGELIEVPLDEWIDVGGSKLNFGSMAKTLVDLAKIEVELEKLRLESKKNGRGG
jgi:dolichyl-phosphate beta-glucosyltransferase